MSKLTLVQVKTDTSKVYKPSDNFRFELTFNNSAPINEDVVFEVTYFGDAYSDDHDQKICHNIIGLFQTSPIDLTKIPINTLFGLTTILIVGKFRGEQFIRIGYVVNVSYPGVYDEKLLDVEDDGMEMPDDEEEEGEVTEEEEGSESNEEHEEGDDTEGEEENAEVEEDEEVAHEEEDEAECEECSGCESDNDIEMALAEALMPISNRKPIPLETPVLADQDDFVHEKIQMPMKKSKIELTLVENPIVHIFDVDWDAEAVKEEADNVQSSSSENMDNVAEDQELKKSKNE